jgi:phage terminase large subunit-like protein
MSVTLDEIRAELAKQDDATIRRWYLALADSYFPEARQPQRIPPGDWATWLILAGRGFGKTRAGAEWIVDRALTHVGSYAIAAPTFGDGRDICVEGESGVHAVLARRFRDAGWDRQWNRSLGEIRLPNGSRIKVGSADEPDRFRGWNFAGAWCDELAAWRQPDTFTQIRFALRVGTDPRMVVTTTPRPTKIVRDLIDRDSTIVTRGSTFDNAANLAPAALAELRAQYEGTRIGRQELYAELLTDTPGALWTAELLDRDRVGEAPVLARVVTAVDPAGTSGPDSDETGIVVAGLGDDGHVYVIADHSCRLSPDGWARRAIAAHDEYEGDRIVAEKNMGWDLVEHTIRTIDPSVPLRTVSAAKGKRVRAEPVAALSEQGKVHIVGRLPELEDQLCTWTGGPGERSPDRLDAFVYAVTELAIGAPLRRARFTVLS